VTPELAAAARAAIAVRTQAGTPGGGWSHAWYVNLWARLQEPEKAGAIIDKFLSRMVTENLMYLSHRGIFQIDANLGMAAGIAEMLIQSHSEVIRLLPAVPPQWATGKANGLRARGGLTFDVDWVDGVLRSARVTAEFGGDFRVGLASNLDATLDLRLAAGETADISHRLGSLHLQGAGQREND
jgi:alpha-L-fucosidase 2